jgi:hypothetical protein
MYLPTRSASGLVLARTRLWTENLVWRQVRSLSAYSELRSSLPDEKSQDLTAKDLADATVVKGAHLMEDARLVHPALGHQEMEMGVKIDDVYYAAFIWAGVMRQKSIKVYQNAIFWPKVLTTQFILATF